MLLDDLSDYLSTGTSIGTTALYKGLLPDTPSTVVGLFESGGLPSVHAMSTGPGLATVEQPRVEVIVRSTEYAEARLILHRIHGKLDGLRRTTINGCTYRYASAVQQPFFLRRDENDRVELACNYQIIKDRSST